VDIDWPVEFGTWLDRLETDARAGDERARTVLVFVARALDQLRNLPEPPRRESETATLRWVRQSRRYPLWRVSHAYHPQAAVRLICWFPPDRHGCRCLIRRRQGPARRCVLRRGSRSRRPLVDQWKRETAYEEKP